MPTALFPARDATRPRHRCASGVRVLSAALLAAAISATTACSGSTVESGQDSWQAASARGHGSVRVLYVRSAGFAYRDDAGRLTGLTVELMREFARFVEQRHGVTLELEFVEEEDWRTFYNRVHDGRGGLFGIGNVTITEERRAEIGFSPPYMTSVAVLITHASVPQLPSLEALGRTFAGMQPLAYAGTLHEDRLEAIRAAHMPGTPLELATSNPEIIERVSADTRYFAYVDVYNYWRAREAGAPLRRHPAADLSSEEFGVIMPHDSDWAPVITEFFEADGGLLEQPLYRDMLRLHLGPELAALLEAARAGNLQMESGGA
jgi:hypothetical protein